MLLLVLQRLIKLLLRDAILVHSVLQRVYRLVTLLGHDARDVLQVVKKNITFLFLGGLGEKRLDLLHVVVLLLEVLFRVEKRVEKIAVLAVLLGLEVEGVEQLEHALGELRDLHVRRALLDLALHDRDLHVLLSQELLLLNDAVVLLVVLRLDLAKNRSMLLLLNLLAALLHLLELLLKALFLFLAAFLQLQLGLSQTSLLFNQGLHDDDFVLLDLAFSDLVVKGIGLATNFGNLICVLCLLVVELLNLGGHGLHSGLELVAPLGLLLDA